MVSWSRIRTIRTMAETSRWSRWSRWDCRWTRRWDEWTRVVRCACKIGTWRWVRNTDRSARRSSNFRCRSRITIRTWSISSTSLQSSTSSWTRPPSWMTTTTNTNTPSKTCSSLLLSSNQPGKKSWMKLIKLLTCTSINYRQNSGINNSPSLSPIILSISSLMSNLL